MSDLSEFLLARIAEDEAFLHADDRVPHARHLSDTVGSYNPHCPTCRGLMLQGRERQIAECESKRQIVEGIVPERDPFRGRPDYDAEWVLKLLALPYVDHPDYRQEWTP